MVVHAGARLAGTGHFSLRRCLIAPAVVHPHRKGCACLPRSTVSSSRVVGSPSFPLGMCIGITKRFLKYPGRAAVVSDLRRSGDRLGRERSNCGPREQILVASVCAGHAQGGSPSGLQRFPLRPGRETAPAEGVEFAKEPERTNFEFLHTSAAALYCSFSKHSTHMMIVRNVRETCCRAPENCPRSTPR